VGVPCGLLDQGVSAFGRQDHLVLVDCVAPSFELVPLPADAHFWVFNTHTRHALVDGLYATRHHECMAAAARRRGAARRGLPRTSRGGPGDAFFPVAYRRARHVTEEIDRVAETIFALHRGDLAAVGAC